MARRRIATLGGTIALLAATPAWAQSPAGPPAEPLGPTALDAVTSTATRTPRAIGDVPATVNIIDAEQLERQNAVRPQDAVRYEPGVTFSNQPQRGGGGNFIIRGIGDNRVRVLIDGVRLPDFPESNLGAGTFTRDFVDLETVRRLEIIRGPASALFGSDAIGGVVNYITKDPGDYLNADRTSYFSGRFGYSGADRSFSESVLGAVRAGNVDFMALYTRRDGQELTPNGRIPPNPQDYSVNSFLTRAVWRATPANTLRVTGEILTRETNTNLLTDRASTGAGAARTTVQDSRGEDRNVRGRVQLDWFRSEPLLFADRMDVRAYWSRLDRREQTTQQRYVGAANPAFVAPNRLRYTDAQQEQELAGTDVQFRSSAQWLGAAHRLTYGLTVERIATSRPRDRYEQNLTTGAVASTVGGEAFPNKNFPDTTTWQTGLYLQDEIRYGRFDFLPAIRLDWYSLTTSSDAAFLRSAASGTAAAINNLNAFAASPKFGATYRMDESYSLYGQYSRGFRAPPYDTANFGFSNRAQGYEILPNGNLKPEYVDSFEAGLRGRFDDGSSFQLTGFYNRYEDFIATQVIGTVGGLQQFQYRNIGRVQIYGAEARGEWRVTPEWRLRGAAAYARSEDLDTGRPVDGVEPFNVAIGAAWRAQDGSRLQGLGAQINAIGALRNTRVANPTGYQAPAYAVLDLALNYDISPNFTVNLGLFTKYFLVSDTRGQDAGFALRDLYAQPGRYFAANLIGRF
jgi:hemoglobin/transferrin/lactoferrin receptor protein